MWIKKLFISSGHHIEDSLALIKGTEIKLTFFQSRISPIYSEYMTFSNENKYRTYSRIVIKWILISLLGGMVFFFNMSHVFAQSQLVQVTGADLKCEIDFKMLQNEIVFEKKAAQWGHIFCGDVNQKRKKATGYHHRYLGQDSAIAKIGRITKENDETGVYEAAPIHVFEDGKWFYKKRGSTFFPDQCSRAQVMNSLLYASQNKQCIFPNGKWGGASAPKNGLDEYCYGDNGETLAINGYFKRNTTVIATGWPLLKNKHGPACETVH